MIIRLLPIIFFLFIHCIASSQEITNHNSISTIIEDIIEGVEDDDQKTELAEDLEYLHNHPVCLINDDLSVLVKVNVISEKQYEAITNYLKWNTLLSVYELQYVVEFDLFAMRRLLPFVTMNCKPKERKLKIKNVLKYGRYTVLIKTQRVLEESVGYNSDTTISGFVGSPEKVYLRANYSYGNRVSLGLTFEKDEGEKINFSGNNNGFDFNSFHFQIKDLGVVRQINIGDFKAGFGQGLCFNSGYRSGKSLIGIGSIDKISSGLQRYTSVEENNYLRGVGVVLGIQEFEASFFLSSKYRDATIITNDEDSILGFSTLISGGIHNTELALNKKHSLKENSGGINLKYRFKKLHLGVVLTNINYNLNKIESDSPENIYSESGKSFLNGSVYYRTRIGSINLFGEVASNFNGGLASINGMVLSFADNSNFVLLHRYYPSSFNSPFGNAFGKSTSNSNEKGLYSAIDLSIVGRLKIAAWIEISKKPWLSSQLNSPSNVISNAVQISYRYKDYNQLYIRCIRNSSFTKDSNIETGIDKPIENNKINLRLHNDLFVSNTLSLRNRIEYCFLNDGNNEVLGWLLYQDIIYKPEILPLVFNFRFAIFDTDDWASRIYSWENDVLYSYSSPANYMKGSRMYLLSAWEVNKSIKIWARISRTSYSNLYTIGSGLSEIDGSHKTDIKLMMRIKI